MSVRDPRVAELEETVRNGFGLIAALAFGASMSTTACAVEDEGARTQRSAAALASGGSCGVGDCGGPAATDDCWCDEACAEYGDCCADVDAVCAAPADVQCMSADAYCGIVCDGQPGPLLAPECDVPSCSCDAPAEVQCMSAEAYCGIVCDGMPGPLLAPECDVPSCSC